MREFVSPLLEVSEMIAESGGESLDLCYQCGTCSGVCPWNLVSDFRVRNVISLAQLGLEGYEGDDLWLCATCNACVDRCPRGVEIVDIIRAARGIVTQSGTNPQTLRSVLGSVQSFGNPWSGEPEARYNWAKEQKPKKFTEDSDVCYFTCCTQAYDSRNMRVARAAIKVLEAAGVNYGALGNGEKCCGDAVRKAGGEDLFQSLAESNISLFNKSGVKRMVVPSPHCLNSFTKEYPELGGRYDVIHIVQLLNELAKAGSLKLKRGVKGKAIYHDPCYLGRHNGVYDAPRELLSAVSGLELIEFGDNRENSICCGGGGGRLWMETPVSERFSVIKLKEALERGADMLVTACPYCISMFEDAKTALNKEDFKVLDVTEVIADAL